MSKGSQLQECFLEGIKEGLLVLCKVFHNWSEVGGVDKLVLVWQHQASLGVQEFFEVEVVELGVR